MRTIVTLLVSLALAHAGELHQAARVCDQERMRQLLFSAAFIERNGRERDDTPAYRNRLAQESMCVASA
jgi:hypothetical protein